MGYQAPRLFIDRHFLNYLFSKNDSPIGYINKLHYIHYKCGENETKNNIILDKCFKDAIKKKETRVAGLLGAMHPVPYWDTKDDSLHSSVLKKSISEANKSPYKLIILTDSNQVKIYKESDHYKPYDDMKSAIFIKGDKDALDTIDEIYNQIKENRKNETPILTK